MSRIKLYYDVKCKFCESDNIVKYGLQRGIQQYLCRACGRKFSDKDTLEGKQTPTAEIGAALSMFYDGLSLSKISGQLKGIFDNNVDPSTIYRWILEYSQRAIEILTPLQLKLGDVWVADETVIDINGRKIWFWDIIDEQTRFLLASNLSVSRSLDDATDVMEKALQRSKAFPNYILSDKLPAYPRGIERVFGEHAQHIQSQGFTADINTNLIERFHGTLKDRVKILRGFKSLESAEIILEGFIINYNFFRPHMTLDNTTPAQEAGVYLSFNTWEGLLRYLQTGGTGS